MANERASRLFLQFSLVMLAVQIAAVAANVPAVFVFGDSTVDVGNNNYLPTVIRANISYNGIDFPGGKPTGRFSNGYNIADFLAMLVGFERSPPPFLSLTEATYHEQIKRGISFASGGAGIFDRTLKTRMILSVRTQIQHFSMVQGNLTAQMGSHATQLLLSKSLFIFSVGSNDIQHKDDQLAPQSNTPNQEFITQLTSKFMDHLTALYKLGARKFGIISIPPVGCCPYQRKNNETGGCLDDLNELALQYHDAMNSLLHNLSSRLEGMKYSLGNSYQMLTTIFENADNYGFKNLTSACCGYGRLNGDIPCLPFVDLCSDRKEFLFWDMFHPSQQASKLVARKFYFGSQKFVAPINFKKLAEDES